MGYDRRIYSQNDPNAGHFSQVCLKLWYTVQILFEWGKIIKIMGFEGGVPYFQTNHPLVKLCLVETNLATPHLPG
jgi:hypothetical protein